jgi:hypothetical protein
MSEKLPYPEGREKIYPPGAIADRRRIIKCSDSMLWYMGMVGEIINVHYFVTHGCWDIKGRWLWYYDLSEPIVRELTEKERNKLLEQEKVRIKAAKAHMNKWDDIPLSMQLSSLCDLLNIKMSEAALKFCTGLLIDTDENNAKILFDARKHEYK